MKDRKKAGSVDEFFRSVYDSLSLKVLAEAAADGPDPVNGSNSSDDLDELEAQIERAAARPPIRAAEKKRARS